MKCTKTLVLALSVAVSSLAYANQSNNAEHNMNGMSHNMAAMSAEEADFTREYLQSMNELHQMMMDGVKDNDPDRAFARSMIPHHLGAIKMAEIQLKYGKDPEMRKLAEAIIKAQDPEIKQMEKWLKK
ncbi:hypothetical protein B0187_08565 [Haemophilus paracuniculus]|uniref:DUF305 domain-containing protein n=1 Tax=Haemophilus paracuniculus TaxID=734 RepID=A0A1T0AQA8_9PAST|nr:DUF305 domain-containing protein [Haemophilus paracuniculus]OOR98315.1 hypothetical protein B0187_08565 [Haemophilus paracuniculus]